MLCSDEGQEYFATQCMSKEQQNTNLLENVSSMRRTVHPADTEKEE